MNAIDMLKAQHREADELFEAIEDAEVEKKGPLFEQLADALAVHTTIEERHFSPAVRARRTEDILLESLEEHLSIKRALAELLDVEADDVTFDAKLKVLKELVQHHVGEEESDLFPKVKKLFDKAQLEEIGDDMEVTAAELTEAGEPRREIPNETDHAPSL